jgi:hypothetical protein
MKSSRIKWSCTFFLIVITLFASSAYTCAATGRQMAESAIASLKSKGPDCDDKECGNSRMVMVRGQFL